MANDAYEDLPPKAKDLLNKFEKDWDSGDFNAAFKKIGLEDLRLALEHFEPLRALVRQIAQGQQSPSASVLLEDDAMPASKKKAKSKNASPEAQEQTLQQARLDLQSTQEKATQLADSLNACTQQCSILQDGKQQLETELKRQAEKHEKAIKTVESQLKDAQDKYQIADKQLRSMTMPPELALLRGDKALAEHFGLAQLPDSDTLALAQVVAVLSQWSNIDRLWTFLKDRCERQAQAASAAEQSLLLTALAWHNHNWPNAPYRALQPESGRAFDFAQHMRSRHTATGETISQLLLPGLLTPQGKCVAKALVRTQ